MAEVTLTILRNDTRPVQMAFKAGVRATPLDLTGSAITLTLTDALGQVVVTKAGEFSDGVVNFPLTLEERSLLKPGRNGRWAVTRDIDDASETWGSGNTNITGGAGG